MQMLKIILLLALTSCSLPASQAAKMTPEQIDAYKAKGFKIINCFSIGGPPLSGNEIFLLIPIDTKLDFSFSSNCSILTGKIN